MILWYAIIMGNSSHPIWKSLHRDLRKGLRTRLLQQLPQPVQLWLQLFVVILQNLHPGLQAALVLAEQFGFCNKFSIAGTLWRNRHHLWWGWQWRQSFVIMLLLQTVILRLQVSVEKRQRSKALSSRIALLTLPSPTGSRNGDPLLWCGTCSNQRDRGSAPEPALDSADSESMLDYTS